MSTGPLHIPFTWLPDNIKDDQNAQFAEMVTTVSMGAKTIGELLRMNNVDQGAINAGSKEIRHLLSPGDLDALTGLMVLSLSNLVLAAEERIDRLDFEARKGAKA